MRKTGFLYAVVAVAALATTAPDLVTAKERRLESARRSHRNEAPARRAAIDDARDADRLYRSAQEAYMRGRFRDAIALSERLIVHGQRIRGASACWSKDRARALKAYRGIDARGRRFLKHICSGNNVKLP